MTFSNMLCGLVISDTWAGGFDSQSSESQIIILNTPVILSYSIAAVRQMCIHPQEEEKCAPLRVSPPKQSY